MDSLTLLLNVLLLLVKIWCAGALVLVCIIFVSAVSQLPFLPTREQLDEIISPE